MQPNPRAETSRLLFPNMRFCIVFPRNRFSYLHVRIMRHRSGIVILPIYCLFLLQQDRIVTENPRPGEQASYLGLARTRVDGEDYAAIALLSPDGKRGSVLIIQGLRQEGVEGEPGRSIYFEALLRI